MTPTVSSAFTPPEHFVRVEKLPPVVQEAIDDNTELWLIRFPTNEIGQTDLRDKRVKLKVDASEGKIGHFASEQGQEYNLIKHKDSEVLQRYAIIPNGNEPFKVRKITCQLGCVKALHLGVKGVSKAGSSLESDKELKPESDVSSGKNQRVETDTQKRHHKSKRRRSEPLDQHE